MRKYDYETIYNKLYNLAEGDYTWKSYRETSLGRNLIEIIASGSEDIGYYLESQIQEMFIDTARKDSSIQNLTHLLGYVVTRKKPAVSELLIKFSPVPSFDLFIPRGAEFLVNGKIPLTVTEDIYIDAGTAQKNFPVVQGVYVQENYELETTVEAISLPSYKIDEEYGRTIDYREIADNYLKVIVESKNLEKPCVYTKNLFSAHYIEGGEDTNIYYMYRGGFENKLDLWFDFIGHTTNPYEFNKTDPSDPTINILHFQYIITMGNAGNIKMVDAASVVDNMSVLQVGNGLPWDGGYKFELLYPLEGGVDEESVKEQQINAPKWYSTAENLVSMLDYTSFIEKQPDILQASVWAEEDVFPANLRWANRIGYTAIAKNVVEKDGLEVVSIRKLTEEEQKYIYEKIYPKKMGQVAIEYIDPIIIELELNITLKLLSGYNKSITIQNVKTMLYNTFDYKYFTFSVKDYTNLDQSRPIKEVPKSDIITAISEMKGIDGCEIVWSTRMEGESYREQDVEWLYYGGPEKNEDKGSFTLKTIPQIMTLESTIFKFKD